MSDGNSLIPPKEKRKRKREIGAITMVAVLFLIFTWAQFNLFSISHKLPFIHSIFFFGLVNLNIVLVLFLFFLVFRNIVKIFVERKGKLIGSSLKSKLIAAFTSFSFVPTILMFLISVFYINSSFDKWFSVKMAGILKDSLEVTNSYYLRSKKKNYHFAYLVANDLKGSPKNIKRDLQKYSEQYSLDAVEYYPDLFEEPIVAVNSEAGLRTVPSASLEFLEKGITKSLEASTIHHFGEGNLVRVIVPVDKGGALVVSSFVPMYLITKMDDIATAYSSFKDLDSLEYPVKSIYMIILILMTLVIMLCATWFGFHLAKGLSIPLVKLGEASEQVSRGQYNTVEILSGSTEINSLVNSFNHMVTDLETSEREVKEANQSLQDTLEVLDEHSRYIEVVLSNVSAGVISVDKDMQITTMNREAESILGTTASEKIGMELSEAFETNLYESIAGLIDDAKKYRTQSIKKDIELDLNHRELKLQTTITFLKDDSDEDLGTVIVLDDITVLAGAQRAAAWREVARRIAHEIKNPLTPIKLAAQRLQRKFGKDIDDPAFKMCVDTIVDQTDGLKKLVNEFSNFARLPQIKLQQADMNKTIEELISFYETGHHNISFKAHLDESLPEFKFDSEQFKRILVNLLDNSVAAVGEVSHPSIEIYTKYDAAMELAKIELEDSGEGISSKDLDKIFEPYYSTKESGTGLGLAIVKKIVEDHQGFIRAFRLSPQGTKFSIELPISKLS
ncbi:MAG: ATP-binding protein [Bdellovibrionales bacterium]